MNKCEGCNGEIDPEDYGDCDTCNLILCGDCVTKHYKRKHQATLRPTDDPTYREEQGLKPR